ncbi:MAG TPA: HK97-gp10 family putative phage morphogenesis protein [Micromonospora sp.]
MDDLDRLIDRLDRAGDDLGDGTHKLVHATTHRTEALGKVNTPVRTGALKNSIGSDFEGGPQSNTIRGETGPDIEYDVYVHGGTSKQPPQPFMDRAADVTEPLFYAGAEALAARIGGADG